jgi:serine/threonine-protein kinase
VDEFETADVLSEFSGSVGGVLGRGGQKVVYEASHAQFGTCVVKVGRVPHPRALERLRREVALLQELAGNGFPRVYDYREFSPDRFLVVEERIPGRPLSEHLTELTDPLAIIRLATRLLQPLEQLWGRNVVHRDVKPANIIMRTDGWPILIDLGIARLLDESTLTNPVALAGPCTPVYASPEQLRNDKDAIGPRTDQFCVGIVLAQLALGGKHPFDPNLVGQGDSIVVNLALGHYAVELVRDAVGPVLASVLQTMLATQPYRRFRDAGKLRAALHVAGQVQ